MRLMVLLTLVLAVFQASAQPTLIQVLKDDTSGETGLAGPTFGVTSPNERYLYVASRFEDAIQVLEIDPVTGMLTPIHTYRNGFEGISGLFGVVDLELSSDGKFLYAAAFDGDAVQAFSCDPNTGTMTWIQTIHDEDADADYLKGMRDVELSADGTLLYTVASEDNALTIFTRDTTTGLLTYQQEIRRDTTNTILTNLNFPANLAVADNGRDIYVTMRNTDSIYHFTRSGTTYTIQGVYNTTAISTLTNLDRLDAIVISPDQHFLYAAADGANTVHAFSINSNGSLAVVDKYADETTGLTNLAGPTALNFDSTATNLFVAARSDAALSVFQRDTATGKLTISYSVVDDTGLLMDLDGLNQALPVLGGRVIYLMGRDANAISVLSFTPPTQDPIPTPDFVKPDFASVDASSILHLNLPDPNGDGAAGSGQNYLVTMQSRGRIIGGPYLIAAAEAGSWPYDLQIDVAGYPLGSYAVGLRRAESYSHASGELIFPSPVTVNQLPAAAPANFNRWLSHVPRRAGGFGAELQLTNRSGEESATVSLLAFNAEGAYLATETVTVSADSVVTRPLYGNVDNALFRNFEDQVSHIAIWETHAGRSRAQLLFSALTTGFLSLLDESNLNDGETAGEAFYVPAKGNAGSGEGFAVLNLNGSDAATVTLLQVDRSSGQTIREVALGQVPAGAKRTFVLSNLVTYAANTAYRIQTTSDARIELVWLSLSGDSFLAPLPVTKQR